MESRMPKSPIENLATSRIVLHHPGRRKHSPNAIGSPRQNSAAIQNHIGNSVRNGLRGHLPKRPSQHHRLTKHGKLRLAQLRHKPKGFQSLQYHPPHCSPAIQQKECSHQGGSRASTQDVGLPKPPSAKSWSNNLALHWGSQQSPKTQSLRRLPLPIENPHPKPILPHSG
jgi:hypothetical protein